MRFRTWPVVALALGGLLLLIVISVAATRQKAQEIYAQLDQLNMRHREVDSRLRRLRSDVHLSGIFVRDYLLDNSHLRGPVYRQRLTELRDTITATLRELEALVGTPSGRLDNLRTRLDDYWETFDPLFDWTPGQKVALSSVFLRTQVLPRRDAVLDIAEEIEAFNDANLAEQRAQAALRERELRQYLNELLWGSLFLGLCVAVAAVVRIRVLEKRSEEQHRLTEQAEAEMRRLSHRLVRAQEEERKNLSRELHDEVGQMLTALRMEVGKAERLRVNSEAGFAAAVGECRRLIDTVMRTVRSLSMGLRPAMLDDFGLAPALEWQARDFERRFHVPVNLELAGNVDRLPEPHRTCVYRVVQEALTNCAKHARATRIEVAVRGEGGRLGVEIRDDGIGLAAERGEGSGLLGIEERVRELHGVVAIESSGGRGTTLRIEMPAPDAYAEEKIAHLAG